MILDMGGVEIIRAGQYYGNRCTNNEAEIFVLKDAL